MTDIFLELVDHQTAFNDLLTPINPLTLYARKRGTRGRDTIYIGFNIHNPFRQSSVQYGEEEDCRDTSPVSIRTSTG